MADENDKRAALEQQKAAMTKLLLQALGKTDPHVALAIETRDTLTAIDSSPRDGKISGAEMAAHVVRKYRAEHRGSDEQIRKDIAAVEQYNALKEPWNKQGEKGPITATMVGKAMEADTAARHRLSELMQDEPTRIEYQLRIVAADLRASQQEAAEAKAKAAQPAVRPAAQEAAPLKPEQFGAAAAGLMNAPNAQAYKDNATRLMKGMDAADPRVKPKQDEVGAQIGKGIDAIGETIAGRTEATVDKGAAVLDAAMRKRAEMMRARGLGDAAAAMLKQQAEGMKNYKPEMTAAVNGVIAGGMAEQKKEMLDGAAIAMGRKPAVAPATAAPSREATELDAAVMGLRKQAVQYDGKIDRITLGDLKKAVQQGQGDEPSPARQGSPKR